MMQDLVVTLVALGAMVILGRRVYAFLGPSPKDGSKEAACASCPSSKTSAPRLPADHAVILMGSLRSPRPTERH